MGSKRLVHGISAVVFSLALWGCDLIRCQFGRSDDPDATCSVEEEKAFVLDHLRDRYLFADQVPALDPAGFDSAESLFSAAIGVVSPPDRYSFLEPRARSDQAAAGQFGGFGVRLSFWPGEGWLLVRVFGTHPPEPSTPASEGRLRRGDVIVAVDGQPLAALEFGPALAALGPDEDGVRRTLTVRRPDGSRFEVELEKRAFFLHTVPVSRVFGGGIGYVLFEAFLEKSEEELDEAFRQLRQAGTRRLVLDLRFNGGGRGTISRHLMNLIVGRARDGELSYRMRYNPQYEDCTEEFHFGQVDQGLEGVEEVVVIVSPGTASASELVWNGLRAQVPVRVVGSPSFGKPYGTYPNQFCGKVLRAVHYRRENAAGQSVPETGIPPDCLATDQVTGALGHPSENLLAAALALLDGRPCPQSLILDRPLEPLDRLF